MKFGNGEFKNTTCEFECRFEISDPRCHLAEPLRDPVLVVQSFVLLLKPLL